MTTDFRALCAGMIDQLERSADVHWNRRLNKVARQCEAVAERARAALADEPAVPEGREPAAVTGQPSDEEWDALVERVWDAHQTTGYQGERFMWDRDFDSAAAMLRDELARLGNPVPAPTATPISDDANV